MIKYILFLKLLQSTFINKIQTQLNTEQHKQDQKYIPFFQLSKIKGIYKSYVSFNFRGNFFQKLKREHFRQLDNNPFVTTFILNNYLELSKKTNYKLQKEQIQFGLQGLQHFINKEEKELLLMFWKQKINKNRKYFSFPENIQKPLEQYIILMYMLYKITDFLHLSKWSKYFLKQYSNSFFIDIFKLPSDTDDTATYLQLQINIKNYINFDHKLNSSQIKQSLLKMSKFYYSPLEDNNNILDPRSYFGLRDFLLQNKNIKLTSTWLQKLQDSYDNYKRKSIPLEINNIDLGVLSNYIISVIKYAVDYDIDILDNKDIRQVLEGNIKVILWSIKSGRLEKRYDLLLLYYPCLNTFYWFQSKIYQLVKQNKDKHIYLQEVYDQYDIVVNKYIVNNIIKKQKGNEEEVYWEGFLGNGDDNPSGEDRLFQTSLILNIFINLYTSIRNEKIYFTGSVKQQIYIRKIYDYIKNNYDNLEKENAFFTGSMKSASTFPFIHPANYGYSISKGELSEEQLHDPKFLNYDLTYGIKGLIEEEKYEEMMEEVWITGKKWNYDFKDLNTETFIYWSAQSLTYSLILTGVYQFDYLFNNQFIDHINFQYQQNQFFTEQSRRSFDNYHKKIFN